MLSNHTNEATVRRFWHEVFNQKNVDVLPELTTDDFRLYYGPIAASREAASVYLQAVQRLQSLPDIGPVPQFEIDELLLSEDTVAVRGYWTNMPPTDWSRTFPGVPSPPANSWGFSLDDQNFSLAFHRMVDGKIARMWVAGIWEARKIKETRVRRKGADSSGGTRPARTKHTPRSGKKRFEPPEGIHYGRSRSRSPRRRAW